MIISSRTVRVLALAATCAFPVRDALAQRNATLTPSQRDLYARVMAMADARTLDTSAVDQALVSGSEPLAAFAALSIGQIGGANAAARMSRLRLLLVDPRARVAAAGAYAIGLLRDSSAVAELARVAASYDDVRALEAAWALGQIGEPARDAIVAALERDAERPGVLAQWLLAAVKLRPVPLEAVLPHLRSDDGSVAWAAAYAIARPRVPAGAAALIAMTEYPTARELGAPDVRATGAHYQLGESSPARIRAEVARGLTRSAAGDSLADAAFTLLTRLAADPHPHVRINALRSLATFEVRARDVVLAGVSDADANVRLAALQAIATAPGIGTIDWKRLWAVDTTFTWRRYVLDASMAHGEELEPLGDWLRSSDWRQRAVALGALTADTARISDSVRVLVESFLTDPDERVRAAASAGLRRPRSDTARTAEREERTAAWYRNVVDRLVVPALAGRPPVAVIETDRGTMTLELFAADAPLTVHNFVTLARRGYYNGLIFHRVVPNFVAQDGDPRGDGSGGPGYSIRDELNPRRYERGVLGMALSGPDTGGSQYFITHSPQPHLDGGYTVFGRVTSGLTVLDALLQGDGVVRIDIR
jgi:cyclophilin family peptidyl-prolyl cis-trans isomerase